MKTLKGTFNGERVKLWIRVPRSAERIGPPAFLIVGDRRINLDDGNMPQMMRRQMPPAGWARTATVDEWRPFLVAAAAHGRI